MMVIVVFVGVLGIGFCSGVVFLFGGPGVCLPTSLLEPAFTLGFLGPAAFFHC